MHPRRQGDQAGALSAAGPAGAGIDPGALADDLNGLTGRPADGVWQGPGRVNLIGEHTDYNGGRALPFAIEQRAVVAVARRADRRWRCWSRQAPAGATPVEVDLGALGPNEPRGWVRYVAGVAWALEAAGVDVPGADLLIDSSVPLGSGLSSSAALISAVAVAVDDLSGAGLGAGRLVSVCHDAEAGFVGAPTGTLDQRAALLAEEGHALLIDFTAGTTEPVPLHDLEPLVIVDTGVRHEHAAGGYGRRRRECEAAAAALGLPSLSAADRAVVEARLTGRLAARARHVVSENERVREVVDRLRTGAAIGELLLASHRSLRDDFEVSCPELDAVVDAAVRAGASGARMTGGGFGGCAIVLGLPAEAVRAATEALRPAAVFPGVSSGPAGRLR